MVAAGLRATREDQSAHPVTFFSITLAVSCFRHTLFLFWILTPEPGSCRLVRELLAYAKLRKNPCQDVFTGCLARDFTESRQGVAYVNGDNIW